MKTLDEKSAEYSAKLCNQSGNYTKGEVETAYVIGASENEELTIGEVGSFGQALNSIQRGRLVTRQGWNGKGMFIFQRPEDSLPTNMIVNQVKSLPESFKRWVSDNYGDSEADKIKFT